MGRLTFSSKRRLQPRYVSVLRNWILPLVITVAMIGFVHAVARADAPPSRSELETYLTDHDLNVFSAATEDFPQVYYKYNDRSIAITDTAYPNIHPVSSGEYVAWQGVINGEAQVFLYDVLDDSLMQLTEYGSNEGVSVHNGQVTWQHWDGSHWQIYYYNGLSIVQVTDGDNSSVRSSTNGGEVIYARQLGDDDWQAEAFNISSGQADVIAHGPTATTAYPHFVDGTDTVETGATEL